MPTDFVSWRQDGLLVMLRKQIKGNLSLCSSSDDSIMSPLPMKSLPNGSGAAS